MDNEMYPLLNELTLRTKGIELEKVEAASVTTKYGEYRGGYFPLRFDRSMSERADIYADTAESLRSDQSLYRQPDTRASSTIARIGTTYKNLAPHLNFSVLFNSLNENIQDLTHREAVNDVWRLIRRPEIRQAIEGVLGENYWVQMKRWLKETAKPEPIGDPGASSLIRKLRRNTALGAMGLKVSVAACQATGIFQSVHKLGPYWTLVGLKEYYGNPANIMRLTDEIYAKSLALANRNKTSFDRDVHEALTLRNPLTANVRDKLTDIYFKPIAFLDQAVANPVWLGGYHKVLKEGRSEAEKDRLFKRSSLIPKACASAQFTASLKALAAENLTALWALMVTGSPVRGFLAVRLARLTTEKTPRPARAKRPSFFRPFTAVSIIVSMRFLKIGVGRLICSCRLT